MFRDPYIYDHWGRRVEKKQRKPYGSLKPKVVELARQNPELSPAEIAERLGCGAAYVRKTFARCGFKSGQSNP